ncbi:MAG: sigma-70 family RNA polymerase sigma factor [Bacteroidales bacterium]|nr:sigma-70 family RNA polymerase sigma factor [Bacteroidales bacterium]
MSKQIPTNSEPLYSVNDLFISILSNLYELACQMTSDQDLANDLVNETYIKVATHFDQFKGGSFIAWCSQIMRNHYYTFVKRNRRCAPYETCDVSECFEDELYASSATHPDFHCREVSAMKLCDSLSEEHKKVLELQMQDFSYDEIAQEMNIPVGTVKSRLHTIRNNKKFTQNLSDLVA